MLIVGDTIEQFVMSCRVFGKEIEKAGVTIACKAIASSGAGAIRGKIKATDKKLLSMTVYADNGFLYAGDGVWTLAEKRDVEVPEHITVGK
jgi:predicted enzyme involved in methoxymalonyl-ACP biosynthesis